MITSDFIHPTAIVSDDCVIGPGTKVWVNAQIREHSQIGKGCIVSKDVYVDRNVFIGDYCKIQNGVSIYDGVRVEEKVFIGPHACFTNDRTPRAFNESWEIKPTLVKKGASIGANATIVCGVTLGEFCMVGAGSVVTRSVDPYTLVTGNPAEFVSYIDESGLRTDESPLEKKL